jgi:hypothetical protein
LVILIIGCIIALLAHVYIALLVSVPSQKNKNRSGRVSLLLSVGGCNHRCTDSETISDLPCLQLLELFTLFTLQYRLTVYTQAAEKRQKRELSAASLT